jgi:hypothetical protein
MPLSNVTKSRARSTCNYIRRGGNPLSCSINQSSIQYSLRSYLTYICSTALTACTLSTPSQMLQQGNYFVTAQIRKVRVTPSLPCSSVQATNSLPYGCPPLANTSPSYILVNLRRNWSKEGLIPKEQGTKTEKKQFLKNQGKKIDLPTTPDLPCSPLNHIFPSSPLLSPLQGGVTDPLVLYHISLTLFGPDLTMAKVITP